ncbi:hypothetical protein SDC9_73736 [bioreactor metagenome]|uniref:Beta-barrel assembly-enhancing protease n=1 Tax=bioreactor metagenome TaxID=1076179 RepID=A0A644YFE8_9ZZZZ
MEEIVREKKKRSRNIPILEKQLAEHPEEPFTLFNMGNEYLSMKDYERALGYYKQAMSHLKNRRIAYVPHLFFRIISCHSCLGHSDQALTAAGEALKEFPACTDYEFLRGSILLARGRYTLAIDSFEACMKMGPPPMQLEFLPGCGTFRPALQMGELYMELEDYERAIRHYNMALSHKSNLYSALYRIGHALGRLDPGGDRAAAGLLSFFTNPKYTPNALLAADILVGEGFLNQAAAALENLTDTQGRESELDYLRGRILLLRGQSRLGAGRLEAACDAPEPETRILRGVRPKSARLLFAAGLMLEDEDLLERALGHIAALCSAATCRAATLMRQIFQGVTPEDPHFAEEGRDEQAVMLDLLEFLLKCRSLELFERLVRGLNYVDGRDLLLNLAKVYDNLGLRSLAAEHVLRSIKELDTVDADGARILLRQLRD